MAWALGLGLAQDAMAQADTEECVALIHGLARSSSSFNTLQIVLKQEGYRIIKIDYPSTQYNVQQLANKAIESAAAECPKGQTLNFVTHSLGGILLRQYLSKHDLPQLGRTVMLGPPNNGSEVVDALSGFRLFQWFNGPAGLQLSTAADSLPNSLGPITFDAGIIAGTRSINPVLSLFLPNPDDGKVSVASTRNKGMNDHITLPITHTFMMRSPKAADQIIHYLKFGAFKHPRLQPSPITDKQP